MSWNREKEEGGSRATAREKEEGGSRAVAREKEEGRRKKEEGGARTSGSSSLPMWLGGAGILVVLAALGVFAIFGKKEEKARERLKANKASMIAPAMPAAAAPPASAPAQPKRLTRREKARMQPMHTNLYGYVINRPATRIVHTNNWYAQNQTKIDRIFRNTADRKIAEILTLEPGETLVGDPSGLFGRGFRRKFLESLESPELVRDDDDEETRELKLAVIDAKADLKARMDAGEDVGEAMLAAYREAQEIGLYREELKKEVARIARDRTLSEQDISDFVEAANKMLAERGSKPLTLPRAAARRLKLSKKEEGRRKKEARAQ